MNLQPSKLLPVSATVLLAFGSFCAVGAPAPTLTLGETLVVTANAPLDGAPTACVATTTANTFTCDNLRSAISHADNNGNGAVSYDRIVLANGSVHTLSVARDAAAEDIDAVVAPSAGTAYNNNVGDLDVTEPVTIETADNAAAKATIEGGVGFNDRLLHVNATAIVNLNNLTLTKGQGVAMNGGALYAAGGTVTIANSLITANTVTWDMVLGTEATQGNGGAIYSTGPLAISFSTLGKNVAKTVSPVDSAIKSGNGGAIYSSHSLTITDSTLGGASTADGNIAVNGGGIQQAGGNDLVIERSTLSYNDAVSGGAINVVSTAVKPFTVSNSTISSNHVTDSGAGISTNTSVALGNTTIANNAKDSTTKGSGLNQISGTATLHNTLLANNTANMGATSANCGVQGTNPTSIASSGGNLSTDNTCALLDGTDQINVADAKIGPLALNDNSYNGNLTHALLTGSPAINKGTPSACPATDERNVTRPQGAVCDVGAYELIILPAPASSSSSGCSVATGKAPIDPLLPALAALGLIGLALRRARRS